MQAIGARGHIDRPSWVWIGIGLQVFVGVMAVPVGLMMVADPNGSPVGIPHAWIADSPFGSFLIPGLFLLLVNGVGQLTGAALSVARHALAPWVMGGLAVALIAWITVQVLIIPLSFLQPLIFVIGVVEGLVALFWLRRIG
ncbi:MAG TPA: hypothetical protein VFY43_06760 [Candidatus Limnocylindria bacterium]|nr:hypothetical protein [Candidatus Limnocylindria bacterium]